MKQFLKDNWFKIGILLIILIVGFILYKNYTKITYLDKPFLKATEEKIVGKEVVISGTAYPKSKILIFINGDYKDEAITDTSGNFLKKINFDREGAKIIKAKQFYKNITSDFSDEINLDVDLTPPSASSFRITSDIPETSIKDKIDIEGMASPDGFVWVNNFQSKINSNGTFLIDYILSEGENILKFRLVDEYGNSTDIQKSYKIVVDSVPPKIATGFCNLSLSTTQLAKSQEYVCVSIDSWTGYLGSVNSVPITGMVKGDIKSISIDGKRIYWDENGDIYQRISLLIYGGLNKYKVVATDTAGNSSTSYVQTTAEKDNKAIDLNINE